MEFRETQGLETETTLKCYAVARDLSNYVADKNTVIEILNQELKLLKADSEKYEQEHHEYLQKENGKFTNNSYHM